ncbi:hypothetical protein H4J50_10010 [Colwellia sp. 6M3]|jgi:hypothetical protein|uniref:hypothetical protein n=1 Tax=Colwellia sp. 6M3 TaxID=2759849 RepID=UPI0015F60551|nr:hypothetical protein [Colwellia sp. 6M3]MBA6416348.1 hypothetical protein [Colwellia sp. 6M3]|tara:strand:+ start:1036 stop:1365 length:330 start_codon:yes stop_codon:yes gene_type:complete
MRIFLLILGWSSVVGSFGDGALGLYLLWLNYLNEWSLLSISINDFLKEYVQIIYWVKQVAFYVLPEGVVLWLFNLPALLYFPIRIIISIFIGWWALSKAAQLSNQTAHS